MDAYIPNWSSPSVKITEKLAKAISTVVESEIGEEDIVHPCGGFLLRTSVLPVPRDHLQKVHLGENNSNGRFREDGFPLTFDMAVEMPETACSVADLEQGRYHSCRQAFIRKLRKVLKGNVETLEEAAELLADQGFFIEVSSDLWGGVEQREIVSVSWGTIKSNDDDDIEGENEEGDSVPKASTSSPNGGVKKVVKGIVQLYPRPSAAPAKISSEKAFKKHPIYSTIVMTDFCMVDLFQRTHQAVTNCSALAEALVSLKAWIAHSGYASTSISFSAGEEADADGEKGTSVQNGGGCGGSLSASIAAMLLYLNDNGFIQASMSAETMVRTFWVQITKGKFLSNASGNNSAEVAASSSSGASAPTVFPFCALGENHLNYLFFVAHDMLEKELKPLAANALSLETWTDVFSHRAYTAPQLRYDCVLCVEHLPSGAATQQQKAGGAGATDTSFSLFTRKVEKSAELTKAIRFALGARAKTIFCDYHLHNGTAVIGINVSNETEAKSRVVRGPSIDQQKKVQEFNDFWGEELTSTRQFSDGAVFRCRVWEDRSASDGIPTTVTGVLREICTSAVERHFGESALVSSPLEDYTMPYLRQRIGGEWKDAEPLCSTSLKKACAMMEQLFSDLANANALPCEVTGFKVISEAGRGTSVFHPREQICLLPKDVLSNSDSPQQQGPNPISSRVDSSPRIEPIHAVVVIDDHGKIPNHLEAIQRMKGALLAQMTKVLSEKAKKIMIRHGGVTIRCIVTRNSIDVVVNGFYFKVYIGHFREISLLRALNKNAEADTYERKLFLSQQHTSFIHQLGSTYGSYCHSVRLSHRWIGAMMLGEYVLPETVELLLAYIYHSRSNSAPTTPAHGFFAFLQLLALFPWHSHPLILPGVEADVKTIQSARKTHEAQLQDTSTKGMMWISAPYAETTSPFTLQTPRPAVLKYLIAAAKSALVSMSQAMSYAGSATNASAAAWAGVWTVNMEQAYDIFASFSGSLLLPWDRCVSVEDRLKGMDVAPASRLLFLDEHDADAAAGSKSAVAKRAAARTNSKMLKAANNTEADAAMAAYITPMVEFDPASQAVKTIRMAIRELGMIMYDPFGPSEIGVILLGKEAKRSKVSEALSKVRKAVPGAVVELKTTQSCNLSMEEAKAEADVKKAKAAEKRKERESKRAALEHEDDEEDQEVEEDDQPAQKRRRFDDQPSASTGKKKAKKHVQVVSPKEQEASAASRGGLSGKKSLLKNRPAASKPKDEVEVLHQKLENTKQHHKDEVELLHEKKKGLHSKRDEEESAVASKKTSPAANKKAKLALLKAKKGIASSQEAETTITAASSAKRAAGTATGTKKQNAPIAAAVAAGAGAKKKKVLPSDKKQQQKAKQGPSPTTSPKLSAANSKKLALYSAL